jgi:hypothetical protein
MHLYLFISGLCNAQIDYGRVEYITILIEICNSLRTLNAKNCDTRK